MPLQHIARVSEESLILRSRSGAPQRATLLVADPALQPLFGMRALQGDLTATLARRDAVAITTRLAQQLWGEVPPAQVLGRSLPLLDGRALVVGAVLAVPDPRSPLPMMELLAGYDSLANSRTPEQREWPFMINGRVFARLMPGTQAEQVGPWMRAAAMAHLAISQLPPGGPRARGGLLPWPALVGAALCWRGERAALAACAGAGRRAAFALLLAAINGTNLRAAELLRRQNETALRRSVGAAARPVAAVGGRGDRARAASGRCGRAAELVAGALARAMVGVWLPELPPWLLAATVGLSVGFSVLQVLLPARWRCARPRRVHCRPARLARGPGPPPAPELC